MAKLDDARCIIHLHSAKSAFLLLFNIFSLARPHGDELPRGEELPVACRLKTKPTGEFKRCYIFNSY